MSRRKEFYSLYQKEKIAVLNIFGDISSMPWEEFGETSNYLLSKKLEELKDVDVIEVFINSYGGEVKEGLAIYNALKRNKAKIITYVDGFACSIASVIFMAGEERILPETACLMVHNPWLQITGNAEELRKQAEVLDTIAEASISAYLEHVNITREELKQLLADETWISAREALEKGFSTSIEKLESDNKINQSIKKKVAEILFNNNIKQELIKKDSIEEEKPSLSETEEYHEKSKEIQETSSQENIKLEQIEKIATIVAQFYNSLEKEIKK